MLNISTSKLIPLFTIFRYIYRELRPKDLRAVLSYGYEMTRVLGWLLFGGQDYRIFGYKISYKDDEIRVTTGLILSRDGVIIPPGDVKVLKQKLILNSAPVHTVYIKPIGNEHKQIRTFVDETKADKSYYEKEITTLSSLQPSLFIVSQNEESLNYDGYVKIGTINSNGDVKQPVQPEYSLFKHRRFFDHKNGIVGIKALASIITGTNNINDLMTMKKISTAMQDAAGSMSSLAERLERVIGIEGGWKVWGESALVDKCLDIFDKEYTGDGKIFIRHEDETYSLKPEPVRKLGPFITGLVVETVRNPSSTASITPGSFRSPQDALAIGGRVQDDGTTEDIECYRDMLENYINNDVYVFVAPRSWKIPALSLSAPYIAELHCEVMPIEEGAGVAVICNTQYYAATIPITTKLDRGGSAHILAIATSGKDLVEK